MRYLITGHTGFKGSWLSVWLTHRGHQVSGVALDPRPGGIYERASVTELLADDVRLDIRDAAGLTEVIARADPEIILHLAAQPLVREAYRDPVTTFTTNVDGTLNVLTALRDAPNLRAAVIVTTDKVYRNVNQIWGYKETDPLGGDDPYSASKSMADLMTQSWTTSFAGLPIAVARAGNVIGGGDVSPERLLPDLLNAYSAGRTPQLRYPTAVRPWQHVLDCLDGYMTLADALLDGQATGVWNFGPGIESFQTVGRVNAYVAELFGASANFGLQADQPKEAELLMLDSTKAMLQLGWRNRLGFRRAVEMSVEWHQESSGRGARDVTLEQIRAYETTLRPGEPTSVE